MAQLTKAEVIEHMLLHNKPTSRYLNIFYVIYFRKKILILNSILTVIILSRGNFYENEQR